MITNKDLYLYVGIFIVLYKMYILSHTPAMKPIMMQFAITKIKIICIYHWFFEKCSSGKCKLSCKF